MWAITGFHARIAVVSKLYKRYGWCFYTAFFVLFSDYTDVIDINSDLEVLINSPDIEHVKS